MSRCTSSGASKMSVALTYGMCATLMTTDSNLGGLVGILLSQHVPGGRHFLLSGSKSDGSYGPKMDAAWRHDTVNLMRLLSHRDGCLTMTSKSGSS